MNNNISPGAVQRQPMRMQEPTPPQSATTTNCAPEDDPFGSAPFSMPVMMLGSGVTTGRKAGGGGGGNE